MRSTPLLGIGIAVLGISLGLVAGCSDKLGATPGDSPRSAAGATPGRQVEAPAKGATAAPRNEKDASGHYYKGNPNAKVVLEDWSDLQ